MVINKEEYNKCANICWVVYNKIIDKLQTEKNVNKLCVFGMTLLNENCKEYSIKTKKKCGVAFPVCISLNNCIGYTNKDVNNLPIKDSDVIKIELGVYINNSLAVLGETYTINDKYKHTIDFLDVLKNTIIKNIKENTTNDDIKIKIESMCTENNVFPIENCFSYQNIGKDLNSEQAKYLLLNYIPYYDDDDNVLIDNLCFDFEKDEVYTINLILVNSDERLLYKDLDSCIYKFNDSFYNLKLKSSREFLSNVKKIHDTNAFYIDEYNTSAKNRIGIKECMENYLLDEYQVYSLKPKCKDVDDVIVFHKKFTIIVGKEKSTVF